uniref:Protein ORF59 n=1 Tax=Mesocestoides corti TaxID=53468 RepID=A0A5K3FC08_MESCO
MTTSGGSLWTICRHVAWACSALFLFVLFAFFVKTGTTLVLDSCSKGYRTPTADESFGGDASCENSQPSQCNSGYIMIGVGAVFGIGFVLLAVYFFYNLLSKRGGPRNDVEAPARENGCPTAHVDVIIDSPPDYETACQALVVDDCDDSISYHPPPLPPSMNS